MPIEITPLKEEDIPGAVECIQEAFADDPYNNWVFDKSKFSKSRNHASLTLRCKWGIGHALFHVAKDPSSPTPSRVLGIAMWLPPSRPSQPPSWSYSLSLWHLWFQQGLLNLRHLGRGGLNATRYYIWKAKQAEVQEKLWTDEEGYWFCNIVTVRPECQGTGVGKRLMGEILGKADAEGRRCYLESSRFEPNVGIYGKMGFEVRAEMECEEGGEVCKLYCMIREPQKLSNIETAGPAKTQPD